MMAKVIRRDKQKRPVFDANECPKKWGGTIAIIHRWPNFEPEALPTKDVSAMPIVPWEKVPSTVRERLIKKGLIGENEFRPEAPTAETRKAVNDGIKMRFGKHGNITSMTIPMECMPHEAVNRALAAAGLLDTPGKAPKLPWYERFGQWIDRIG